MLTLVDIHAATGRLAVLRSEIDGDSGYHSLRSSVSQQSQRMHDIVSYQLSRATASRHQVFSTPLAIESAAEEDKEVTVEWVEPPLAPHDRDEPVVPAPKIDRLGGEVHAHARRQRQHDERSAATSVPT